MWAARHVAAVVVVAALCAVAGGEFSNTLELESVTTYYSCTEAFPSGLDDAFAAQACVSADAPVTAIRYIVRPGEDDADGGESMNFYVYPPPFAVQPINQDTGQNGAPPDNPCAYSTSTTNCSAFVSPDADSSTGPIQLTVRATHAARKYYLRPILEEKRVPYTYTEHNLLIPRCNDEKNKCYNQCDDQDGVHGPACQSGLLVEPCNPNDKCNKGYSQAACCMWIDDYYVKGCTDNRCGSIFTQAQRYSKSTGGCGPQDTYLLLQDGKYNGGDSNAPPTDTPLETCRACFSSYDKSPRREASQSYGNDVPIDPSDPKCNNGNAFQATTVLLTPSLHPTLCPGGVGHYANYPTTTSDLHSHGYSSTDAYSLEPYYYWCQSQCVGDGSYTTKDVWKLQQTNAPCATGTVSFKDTGLDLSDVVTSGGEKQFNYNQYTNAYLCSMDYDHCPEVAFAHSVDEAYMPCCNSTFLDPDGTEAGGSFASTCAASDAPADKVGNNPGCGGIAAEQVRNAAAYLTAACDAQDSGESLCNDCNNDHNLAATGPAGTENLFTAFDKPYVVGWQCPGWPYNHLRPAISLTTNIDVAKCSVECQTDEFIRWQVSQADNQCTSSNKCSAYVEQVVSERAIIEMGYGGCHAYEVVPEPILDIAVQLTLTAPDGTTNTTLLSTTSDTSSVATVYIDGVKFTHRINDAFLRGGAGPQISGLIVICNPDLDRQAADDVCCQGDTEPTGQCGGVTYDPYTSTAPDLNVLKPEDDNSCSRWQGGIRGVFPEGVMIDGKLTGQETPQVNPWPQLVRKMIEARGKNENYGAHEDQFHGTGPENTACHVPAPKYLGVVNCGRPVYWYYVPEERKSSIGLECGKTGVQNSYARTESGRRIMCLQGGNSCTPGYGEPRFTESGAPFYRTPCQELGDMVKTLSDLYDDKGDPKSCSAAIRPSALDMPGFTYLGGKDVPGGDASTVYPNTWVHGPKGSIFLYQQMPTSEQQNIQLDVETYTDSYYGGNLQTYTDGILVPEASTICYATVNDAPGVFSVGVQNTNLAHSGTYFVSLACADTITDSDLGTAETTGGPTSVSPDGTSGFLVNVGAGQTQVVSWSIVAGGAAPTPTPTPAPAPSASPTPSPAPSTNIGIPTCTATLRHGGGDYAVLATLKANCETIAASVITPDRATRLDQTIKNVATCKDWQIFCWLSNQGPIETFMVLTLLLMVAVAGVIIAVQQVRLTVVSFFSRREMRQYTTYVRELEVARQQDEASVVVKALSPQKKSVVQ